MQSGYKTQFIILKGHNPVNWTNSEIKFFSCIVASQEAFYALGNKL